MSDLLESGSDWLAGQLKAHAGREVVYRRGAESAAVTATIGRTEFETIDEHGAVGKWEARDYLIHAADLLLGGAAVLPERGDRIEETQGNQTFVYEVLAPSNEPVWRYSDAYRTLLRVHTKHVATESV